MKDVAAKNKQDALDNFMGSMIEAQRLSAIIREAANEHLGVDPDNVMWADAGSAGRLVEDLQNIVGWLKTTKWGRTK